MIRRLQVFSCAVALGTLSAIAAIQQPTPPIILNSEQAVKEGRALVDEMLSQKPDEGTSTGKMAIHGKTYTQFPIKIQTVVTATNWLNVYEAALPTGTQTLTITHNGNEPIKCDLTFRANNGNAASQLIPDSATNNLESVPFAGSDFSVADLALEFLHWPDQRLLQKEMKRSRSCRVLESVNPHPAQGGYASIKSWVDAESHGILYAEAYDPKGTELKEFYPKDFNKVNGQWQLHEMQISDARTDSRTTVTFDQNSTK